MHAVCILCAFNRISTHTVCILCAVNVIGVHVVCIVCAACVHYTDPMHDNEHGNSMLTVKCSVIKLQNFGEVLGDRYALRVHR